MDRKTQDLAWSCLPREFREEVKKEYRKGYVCETLAMLITLFGHHNLTSDAEGEDDETLYVSRKKLQYFYENLRRAGENHAAFALQSLFGSKCLPDENSSIVEKLEKNEDAEPKPAEPKFKRCEKVIIPSGEVCIIEDTHFENGSWLYLVGDPAQWISESDLEAYSEPGKEAAKMNPIGSKVSVYIATKEEDEEFRRILHNNGFKWNTDSSLILDTFWSSRIEETKIYYLHPDKTVTYYGDKKFDTLTFSEFKKRYFEENVNLSQETANCDKHFDNILKDSFAKERRLNIATTIIGYIIKSGYYSLSEKYQEDNIKEMVKVSLQITDAIMAECEKGGDNEKAQ